jgi:hypothetical protein
MSPELADQMQQGGPALMILRAQLDVAQGMRDGRRASPEDRTCVPRTGR